MELNKQLFKKKFEEIDGDEPGFDVTDTYEELFDLLCDPDEFEESLESALLTATKLLSKEGKLKNETLDSNGISPPTESPSIFYGDLKVIGDLYIKHHTFVLGTLEVTGVIFIEPHCILSTVGKVTCEGLLTCQGYIFVLNHFIVKKLAMAVSNGFMMIKGKLKTQAAIIESTWVVCDTSENALSTKITFEKIQSKRILEISSYKKENIIEKISSLLPADLIHFDENGYWQFNEIFERIAKNKTVLK